MDQMLAVELFAGIGGFRLASDRVGLRTVWANDFSDKACTVYRGRYGDRELREGDFAGLIEEVPTHHLLTAGFPCQPFSSAGKKEGVRDARGTLFQHIVNVLKRHRPKFFVLENVKRLLTMEQGCHFATILGALAGLDYIVEWRLLNAMYFGLPQNRERVVIVGELVTAIPREPISNSYSHVRLANVEDLRSLRGDCRNSLFDQGSWRTIADHTNRFEDWGLAHEGRFFATDLDRFASAYPPVNLASVLERDVPDEFDFTDVTRKWVTNNTPVNRFVNGVEILSNQKGGARMGYTIFGVNGVAPTLTSTTSRHYERYLVGDRYRRLTNVEYARIQGFPDDYCREVSVYDQYALYGNAVPPPMAEWVLRRLALPGIQAVELPRQPQDRTLFDYA